MGKFIEFVKLCRFYAAPITALLPIYGALSTGMNISTTQFLVLFLIGLLGHVWGFILNDYADMKVDEFLKVDKPLIVGTISKKEAITWSISCVTTAFLLTLIFFRHPLPIAILGISGILGCIYCFFSKRAPGLEIFASSSFSTFCLFGSVAISLSIPLLSIVIFFFVLVQQVFENGVIGGLKDCGHDFFVGKTTVLSMGAALLNRKTFKIPKKLKIYIFILRGMHILALLVWFIVLYLIYGYFNIFLIILTMFFMAILIHATRKFVNNPTTKIFPHFILIHIVLCYYVVIPIMLYPFIGVYAILLMIIPYIWHASFWQLLKIAPRS
jgi:4-hydroxybenzoate polyprenyltransferase